MKTRLARWLRIWILLYVVALMILVLLERVLVYPAPSPEEGIWDPNPYSVESVDFRAADGVKLHGWYAGRPAPDAYVVFCHGNGEHVGHLTSWVRALSDDLNVAVFAFDYRGYGKSDGKPHEAGILADGEAAVAWLSKRAAIRNDQVVLYGRSLGGGVAVHLAAQFGARALVIERTFHSMVEIGAAQYPWLPVRWVMRNRFPSSSRIARYSGPLLQMHGAADRLIPLASARTLFEACPSPNKEFLEVPGLTHNGMAPTEFYDAFRGIIASTQP